MTVSRGIIVNLRPQFYQGCSDCCLFSVQSFGGKTAMLNLHANMYVINRLELL